MQVAIIFSLIVVFPHTRSDYSHVVDFAPTQWIFLSPPSFVFSCMILQFASILPRLEVDFNNVQQIEE